MKTVFIFLIVLISISKAGSKINSYTPLHATVMQDTLQQYTGKYKFPEGNMITEITVTLDNGVLTGTSAMGSSELKMTQGDVFEIVAYAGTATFKRNAEGKISGVHVLVGDIDMEGSKTEGEK